MRRASLQGILAPMVLENLGCTGDEARLVDCPGSQQSDLNDYGYITDYGYTYYGFRTDGCDPLEPSYAFVACGNTTGPGANPHAPVWLPRAWTACMPACEGLEQVMRAYAAHPT